MVFCCSFLCLWQLNLPTLLVDMLFKTVFPVLGFFLYIEASAAAQHGLNRLLGQPLTPQETNDFKENVIRSFQTNTTPRTLERCLLTLPYTTTDKREACQQRTDHPFVRCFTHGIRVILFAVFVLSASRCVHRRIYVGCVADDCLLYRRPH